MFTRKYWEDLSERIIASAAAGALVPVLGATVDFWDWDWRAIVGGGLSMGFLSLLKGLAARKVGDRESAAFRRSLHHGRLRRH